MLPKWHVLLGVIFSLLVWAVFPMNLFYPVIILLSSVLIDVDHYAYYLFKYKDSSIRNAYTWYKNIKPMENAAKKKHPEKSIKASFCIFHTIEFLLIILIISFFSKFFMFLFIGLIFHSLVDILDLKIRNDLHLREFSFFLYLKRRKSDRWHYL